LLEEEQGDLSEKRMWEGQVQGR